MRNLLVAAMLFLATAEPVTRPLPNAHSHNDYAQPRPLWDALDRGFCSVEADVFLAGADLLVGHTLAEIRPGRTLESLYLAPLAQRVKENGGRVHRDGPAVTLLVDLKSDGASSYATLRPLLRKYGDMLTRYADGTVEEKAVTIILSGNRPVEALAAENERWAFIDGRLPDLESNPPVTLVPLISANFAQSFRWRGQGEMPAAEKDKLTAIVKRAHDQKRRVRFWSIPDVPAGWKAMQSAGVDCINTDKLAALQAFLSEKPEAAADAGETLLGQPADLAPSAYLYRADRKDEASPPEAEFLFTVLGHPREDALCGLLWEEPRAVERVELVWPSEASPLPRREDIVVRWMPHGDSSSWWSRRGAGGGAAPKQATVAPSRVSADGRTFIYEVEAVTPARAMDNLVVASRGGLEPGAAKIPVPRIRAFASEPWKRARVEIEWGFQPGTETRAFDGAIEAYNGIILEAAPLAGDTGTAMVGERSWRSTAAAAGRRGIAASLLYLGKTINTTVWQQHARLEDANRTIVTVGAAAGSFSFLPADLESGPILAPEYGFFVRALELQAAPRVPPEKSVAPRPRDLLRERMDSIEGNDAVRGWSRSGMPWFGANAKDAPVTVGTFTLPPRSVAMHPAPDRPVAVGWGSPLDGSVAIAAKVADADPSCGDGVTWSIALDGAAGPRTLASGDIENGGPPPIIGDGESGPLAALAVERGDLLSLAVAARGENHSCDTTVVALVVREIGGQGRVWDLTRDVGDDIVAGNPHADGAGAPAVWSFYMPEAASQSGGVPLSFPSHATSARDFQRELAAQRLTTIRERVRDREEQTWEGAMEALHPGRIRPPHPEPAFEPPARIDVPDGRLRDAWRSGAWHLLRVLPKDARGRSVMRDFPYDALAHESFLIIRALDLQGMHEAARDGLARWLERDEAAPIEIDGLFASTGGALSGVEWDWQHAGGPGVMAYQAVEHYLLTGDRAWFAAAVPKLTANADWTIRERHSYPRGGPRRERLWTRGLLPPHNIWDSTNWRPWYETNANFCFGLERFALALADLDPAASTKYLAEAKAYAIDILAAVDRSFVLSPVIRVRDGTYRSFLPPAPYIRGPASRFMPTSFGNPVHTPGLYPDAIRGGVHLINLSGLLGQADRRAQGMIDVLEDRLLLEHHHLPERTPGYDPERHWLGHAGWYYQCGIERTADVHLQWDDIPNFLRTLYNQYAVDIVVGPYTFNEHTTRGPPDKSFEESAFLVRVRNMLVMEDGERLWLARGTPRAWLAQGKRIATTGMPSRFGAVGYEIVSDVANGAIRAAIALPARRPPAETVLRLRHPSAAPLKSVTVDGQAWTAFDPAAETVRLRGLAGTVKVEARY